MDSNTKQEWDGAFNTFDELSPVTKRLLRNNAAQAVIDEGAEEVGSSDINHRLFADYQLNDSDWGKLINYYFDRFIENAHAHMQPQT